MITGVLLTALFGIILTAFTLPLLYIGESRSRTIYCLWMIPGFGAVQSALVYFFHYRHFRWVYYQAEQSVAETVRLMSEDAAQSVSTNQSVMNASFNSAAAKSLSFTDFADTTRAVESPQSNREQQAELIRLRKVWSRRPNNKDKHRLDPPCVPSLSDVRGIQLVLQNALRQLQRLETTNRNIIQRSSRPPSRSGSWRAERGT